MLLKCPESKCNECIPVSLLQYPKYNKTKRPRRGVVLSNAKWYVYSVQSHLLKYHKNEDTADEISGTSNDHAAQPRATQQIETGCEPLGSSAHEAFQNFSSENHKSASQNNESTLAQGIENENIPEHDGQPSEDPTFSGEHLKKPIKRKSRLGLAGRGNKVPKK